MIMIMFMICLKLTQLVNTNMPMYALVSVTIFMLYNDSLRVVVHHDNYTDKVN